MADTIIKNGYIFDGSGNPWFYGDVSITDGIISKVGNVSESARNIIDAKGLAVAPGFIDMHTHSDTALPVNPFAESKIRQGVTTEVTGNCGNSSAPIANDAIEEIRYKFENLGLKIEWRSLKEYLNFIEKQGCSVNFAALVGHGTIRKSIVGYDNRTASENEIEKMKQFLAEAMADGAFGMSTGLIYPPGCYTDTDELVKLTQTVSDHHGIYVSHIRDEGAKVLEAGEEAIHIGRQAKAPIHWSHVKAAGSQVWGKSKEILALIEQARSEGIDVSGDVYPYEATSTGLSMFLPKWVHEGGRTKLIERLKDPAIRARLAEEITARRKTRGNWDKIIIASVSKDHNRLFEGMSVDAISAKLTKDPVDVVIDLLADDDGEVGMVSFAMSDEDIQAFLKHPQIMVGSDGNSLSPHGVLGNGKPHPRHYGTFPRILGHYVREKQVLPLELAIKKMTSLPAWRLGLHDRGFLAPGMKADIVIFDPDKVADQATYADPHQYPTGIPYVMVNGVMTIHEGSHTLEKAGQILRRNA